MITKRAQTATEYLIILAVVIVIALMVVSVMGGIPGVGKSGRDKADAIFWMTSDIAIPAYGNSETGTPVFKIKNNIREGVTITSFSLDGVNVQSSPGVYIQTGETVDIPLNANVPACVAGESFAYTVEINYTTDLSGSYTFTGYNHQLTGKCGN